MEELIRRGEGIERAAWTELYRRAPRRVRRRLGLEVAERGGATSSPRRMDRSSPPLRCTPMATMDTSPSPQRCRQQGKEVANARSWRRV